MMGYYGNMMAGYGAGIWTITVLLLWGLMGFGIAALWKYISKK